MTAKSRVSVLLAVLLLFGLAALWSCGNSGGDDNTPDPGAVRPAITGLSRSSANIGDQVEVYGLNFGTNQSGGNVRLNGLDFTVNDWTDTMLDITVVQGMVSGIVVVTVGNLSSQSGPEAQLFIPAEPAGRPLINALIPDYGEAGDQVLISGSNFGGPGAGGQVFFDVPEVAVSQAGEPVLAEVVTVEVDGTAIPQWGASSIKVLVPFDAPVGGAVVYVVANGEQSNKKEFMVLPTPYDDEAPVITIVDPPNGEIGTAITIEGDRFGHIQSGSIAELGDMNLNVVTWSNTTIQALVPDGAVTGKIRVTVNGKPSNEVDFTVANTPRIDSVSPYEIRVGNPFQVTGVFFGLNQGTGRLTIGGTAQEIGTWNNTVITVPSVSPISASGDQIEVIVTADNGLSSEPAYVELVSDLDVRVSVDPTAGQRNDQSGQGGTEFAFQVSVAGGSGDYTYHLIPDAGNPSVEAPSIGSSPVTYTYPFVSGAQDEVYYDTKMRVVDNDNQDSVTVAGPTVLVVNPGVPVITRIALSSHNRGTTPAPNDWCYTQDGADYLFHDFTFTGGNRLFTSAIGDIMSGGNPLASYTRNELAFTAEGSNPRPYGYRYKDTAGSEVEIQGLNFGATQGTLTLGVSGSSPTQIDVFTSWTDMSVKFQLPAVNVALSGTVSLTPLGNPKQATSVTPLICSPYVNSVVPDEVDIDIGTVTLSGFDYQPTVLSGVAGSETYGIWMVRASYDDPFVGGNVTDLVLLTTPIVPTTLLGTTMSFSMASLDVDGNGTVPVEVFNAANDASQVVEGTLEIGGYYLFLWTGALTDGTNNELATSGVFSEAYPVEVVTGGGPIDDPPVPNLQVAPTSGDAPLTVNIDASGSTDDGTITKFEFDFGEGAGLEDFGLTSSTDHTYAADGSYQVRVQVTDDATPTPQSVASAPITVTVGGGGPGSTITVTLTVNFNTFDGANLGTLTKLFEQPGDVLVDQDFRLHTDGVPDVLTFSDVDPGTYAVEVNRIVTNWVGFGDIQARQTVTVPPDANVEFVGNQTADPPPPG